MLTLGLFPLMRIISMTHVFLALSIRLSFRRSPFFRPHTSNITTVLMCRIYAKVFSTLVSYILSPLLGDLLMEDRNSRREVNRQFHLGISFLLLHLFF